MLSKEQLINSRKSVDVEISSGIVRLRQMGVDEYMRFEEMRKDCETDIALISLFLAFSIVNEDNQLMFSIDEVGVISGCLAAVDCQKLFEEAQELNGLGDDDEELVKK